MRKGVFLILINMMILLVIFALLMQSMLIVQRIAAADKLTGRVEVQRSGEGNFKLLKEGDFIKTKDVVRTSTASTAEFSWADGTRWKLMPSSELIVKKATFNAVQKAEQNHLHLSAGKVFVRIMKALAPASRFEVETPTAVAAVRGTIFSVEVANGKTEVCVYKGHVKVTAPGEDTASAPGTIIEPGMAAIANGQSCITSEPEAQDDNEFLQHRSILKPELETSVLPLKDNKKAIIKGKTEVGDTVTINGRAADVLANGSFFKNFKLQPGMNTFTIVSRDKHNQETTKIETVEGPKAGS